MIGVIELWQRVDLWLIFGGVAIASGWANYRLSKRQERNTRTGAEE